MARKLKNLDTPFKRTLVKLVKGKQLEPERITRVTLHFMDGILETERPMNFGFNKNMWLEFNQFANFRIFSDYIVDKVKVKDGGSYCILEMWFK